VFLFVLFVFVKMPTPKATLECIKVCCILRKLRAFCFSVVNLLWVLELFPHMRGVAPVSFSYITDSYLCAGQLQDEPGRPKRHVQTQELVADDQGLDVAASPSVASADSHQKPDPATTAAASNSDAESARLKDYFDLYNKKHGTPDAGKGPYGVFRNHTGLLLTLFVLQSPGLVSACWTVFLRS
jgi:hypothetical protein